MNTEQNAMPIEEAPGNGGGSVKLAFLILIAVAVTGCIVVSENRVFPKLAPFWSLEAKAQRQYNREHKKAVEDYEKQKAKEGRQLRGIDLPRSERQQGQDAEYTPLALKIQQRDGTNFIGQYMGMIAEWSRNNKKWDPVKQCMCGEDMPDSVMMFSATSGELLKWISYEDFKDIFVLKIKPEYQ